MPEELEDQLEEEFDKQLEEALSALESASCVAEEATSSELADRGRVCWVDAEILSKQSHRLPSFKKPRPTLLKARTPKQSHRLTSSSKPRLTLAEARKAQLEVEHARFPEFDW